MSCIFVPDDASVTYATRFLPRELFDPDALLGINAIIDLGGTLSNSDKAAINTFVLGLKADDLWGSLAGLFLFVGGTDACHSMDFISRTSQISFVNSPTHSAFGVEFDGYASYGELALGTFGGTSSTHLAVYANNGTLSSGGTLAGASSTGILGTVHLSLYYDGSGIAARGINDNVILNGLSSATTGFFGATRTSANSREIVHSISDYASDSEAAVDLTGAPFLGCNNSDSSPTNLANVRLSFLSVGGGISLYQLQPRVSALQSALGRA